MDDMRELAQELLDTFGERGYKIDEAIQSDRAFSRTKHAQSDLVRALVLTTIEESAGRLGLGCLQCKGGAVDLQHFVGTVDRRYRVRKAEFDAEHEQYEILCGSDAIHDIADADPDALTTFERWVFAYTVDGAGMLVDIFAARVLGDTGGAVARLLLGPIIPLGADSNLPDPDASFQPDDDDDDLGLAQDEQDEQDQQDENEQDKSGDDGVSEAG